MPYIDSRTRAFTGISVTNRAIGLIEKHAGKIAAVLLVIIALIGIGQAAHKLFSYDEYVTYRIGSLSPVREVWNFYRGGLDTTSPLPALVVHGARLLPFAPEVSSRIPSVFAFAGMSFGVFGFLHRRYSATFALSALLLPLELPTLAYHMTEARAYAFLIGATGLAVFFWQLSNDHRFRPWSVIAFWLSLAVAILAHFFAIFLVVPFALGQLVHDFGHKKLDLPIWLSIFLYPAAWLPLVPGALQAQKYYGAQFWAKPVADEIMDVYQAYISTSWVLVMVLAGFILGISLWQWRRQESFNYGEKTGLSGYEWTFAIALLFLPLYAWAGSLFVGAYQFKYAAPFGVGLIICLLAGFAELCRRNPKVGLASLVLIFLLTLCEDHGWQLIQGVSSLRGDFCAHQQLQTKVQQRKWVRLLSASNLPVAVDNDTYRLLDFYGSTDLAKRSYGLTDFVGSAAHIQAMTDQENLALFASKIPLNTMEVDKFIDQHSDFLIVAPRTHRHYEWLPEYLIARQQAKGDIVIRLVDLDNDDSSDIYPMAIYEVQR